VSRGDENSRLSALNSDCGPHSENPCQLNRSLQHHLLYIFFLKVVFMAQHRRVKLAAIQRTEVWSPWKAGQSIPRRLDLRNLVDSQ
jgi:hypothetical protein